jgi:hypothetical protein
MPRTSSRAVLPTARAGAVLASVALVVTSAAQVGGAHTTASGARPDRSSAPSPAIDAKASARALELDIRRAAPSTGYTTFANAGSAVLHISVVADDGGTLVDGAPRTDPAADRAVRTPKHVDDPDAPHAVIQVVDRRGADDLDPGLEPFRYGADFNLDTVSEDTGPGGRDNGDNLLQRGLYYQQAQYKIQLDHGIATCRVKGSLGAVSISSSVQPVPGTWYRVRCVREGDQLTIVLTRWQDGLPTSLRESATGSIGVVSPARRTVPLSVGGKLARRGVLDYASDQFNGRIDNVVLRVG